MRPWYYQTDGFERPAVPYKGRVIKKTNEVNVALHVSGTSSVFNLYGTDFTRSKRLPTYFIKPEVCPYIYAFKRLGAFLITRSSRSRFTFLRH